MKVEELQEMLLRQKTYFSEGKTLPLSHRRSALQTLEAAFRRHETEITAALQEDLGKSPGESYLSELGMVRSELHDMLRHLKRFSREKRVATPLAQSVSRSYVKPSPRGMVLIMSPWNYPFLLSFDPLIDALAAGNTVVLKPSSYAAATSRVMAQIVEENFDPGLVCVVTGGREENRQLLEQTFDFIFFTGSQAVGKEVLRRAAEHLTPVSLELGGKSPCIVDGTADLALSARRIVFGKFLNCGQTCVAPDYILCDETIAEPLKKALEAEIVRQYGEYPLDNAAYGKIINGKHFHRLERLLDAGPVCFGGQRDADAFRIAPTILGPCTWEDACMQEEIFGPLLPILSYRSLEEALAQVNARPHPLALYLFSRDRDTIRHVTERCSFGGGCINDTVIHLATTKMGFGGVGASGMGAYHGKVGFDTFSHSKSIVDKKTWLDLPMRYQPYTPLSQKLVRWFLR